MHPKSMTFYRFVLILFSFSIGLAPLRAIPYSLEYLEANQLDELEAGEDETVQFFKYGNFDQWLVRNIKESGIIGGQTKTLYCIAPNATWNNNNAYHGSGGSPWASSNVLAKVSGVTKTNVSVYREARKGHGYCAKLVTHFEEVKVLGLINIKVLAAGSIFLGQMLEPITDTKNPMAKMNVGVRFTKKPKALIFDYKVKLSPEPNRIKQTGFGGASTVAGRDYADCVLFLQKRWEDANGNIYAKRVATMVKRFGEDADEWVNDARFTIHYGDITNEPFYTDAWALTSGETVRYARNSKGKIVEVKEVGWGDENDTPTHIVLQFDSSHGGAYVGSIGNTLWVDNVRLAY